MNGTVTLGLVEGLRRGHLVLGRLARGVAQGRRRPVAARRVQRLGKQAGDQGAPLLQVDQGVGDAVDGVVVLVLAGELGQARKLHRQGAELGNADSSGHVGLGGILWLPLVVQDGHPVGRVEDAHEDLGQLLGLVEEEGVGALGAPADIVGGDQTAEIANSSLEDGDVEAVRVGKVDVLDGLGGLVKLVLHAGDPQRVERVDQGGRPAAERVAVLAGDGGQLIVHPRVLSVAGPGALELGLDLGLPLDPLRLGRLRLGAEAVLDLGQLLGCGGRECDDGRLGQGEVLVGLGPVLLFLCGGRLDRGVLGRILPAQRLLVVLGRAGDLAPMIRWYLAGHWGLRRWLRRGSPLLVTLQGRDLDGESLVIVRLLLLNGGRFRRLVVGLGFRLVLQRLLRLRRRGLLDSAVDRSWLRGGWGRRDAA